MGKILLKVLMQRIAECSLSFILLWAFIGSLLHLPSKLKRKPASASMSALFWRVAAALRHSCYLYDPIVTRLGYVSKENSRSNWQLQCFFFAVFLETTFWCRTECKMSDCASNLVSNISWRCYTTWPCLFYFKDKFRQSGPYCFPPNLCLTSFIRSRPFNSAHPF